MDKMTYEDWAKTKRFAHNLPEVIGVGPDEAMDAGYVYFDPEGEVLGYIEYHPLKPTDPWYILTVNGHQYEGIGDAGLNQLQSYLWNAYVRYELLEMGQLDEAVAVNIR